MQLQREGVKLCFLNRVGESKYEKRNLSVHFLPRILCLVPIFHFPISRSRSRFPVLVSSGNKTFQVHDSAFETSWILIDYAEPLSSEPQKDAENFAK